MKTKESADDNQTLIWSIRRLLTEWAGAHERIRNLTAETQKYEELSRDCYDTLYRSIPDGTPRGNGYSHDLSQTLERAERLRRECSESIRRNYEETSRLFRLKMEADSAVWALPGYQERIITLRYKRGLKWDGVARKVQASERACRRWELDALKILAANEKLSGFVRNVVL